MHPGVLQPPCGAGKRYRRRPLATRWLRCKLGFHVWQRGRAFMDAWLTEASNMKWLSAILDRADYLLTLARLTVLEVCSTRTVTNHGRFTTA